MIPASQVPAENRGGEETPSAGKSYSIEKFAAMTYLTVHGVAQWLKKGLLKGQIDPEGKLRVSEASLDIPNVKRLIRGA